MPVSGPFELPLGDDTVVAADSNIVKLLIALVGGIQDLENMLQALLTERSIDTATGVQLDMIGKIVGQARTGLDDDTYRRYVRAKIATNRSNGTIADLITVTRLALADTTPTIVLQPQAVATVVERIDDDPLTDVVANALLTFLLNTVSAGVHLILESDYVVDSDQWFFALSAFVPAPVTAGATTITVDSTTDFPPTGSLIIDEGTAVSETVTYSSTTPTSFTISALAHNHPANTQVALSTGPGKGMGDTSDLTAGGQLARATDATYTAVIVP